MTHILQYTDDFRTEESLAKATAIIVSGGKPLRGTIHVGGAKNSVPKNMVAALLTDEDCELRNVPEIRDVEIMSEMIRLLGGEVISDPSDRSLLRIHAKNLRHPEVTKLARFAGISRIPILLCGPLLAKTGVATIPKLGGCQIGPRPVDFHLQALEKFGATIDEVQEGLRLSVRDRPKGCKIRLDYPSVGTTEQVILTAVLARGTTELSNAAIEPEIIDLIVLLQKMGAIIAVSTDRVITIDGVERLKGFEHTVMPDRLEVASWACAAVATDGEITVKGARLHDMTTFLNMFRKIGGDFWESRLGDIVFKRAETGRVLHSVALETDVHPGFMTDWQQPFVLALTQAEGVSVIHETVYEDRFGYVGALNAMGAQIQLYAECLGRTSCRFGTRGLKHSAVIVGPCKLKPMEITIPDLRAGFTYVIAALLADGESRVDNIQLIQRGYEKFFDKLQSLGVEIKLVV